MGIFIAYGEAACRGSEQHVESVVHSLADGAQIEFGVACGLIDAAVGNLGHTAALLPGQKPHTDADGIEHSDEVLPQLREIIVDVAAVEVGRLAGIQRLCPRCLAAIPGLEACRGVLRECAVPVDAHRGIHQILHRVQPEGEIHQWSEGRCHRSHEVGIGQHGVAQRRAALGIFDAGGLDDIAYAHIVGTCHLASFAVETVFECFIIEEWLLQPIALAVGTGLFRTGIIGIDGCHRAVDGADGAFYARFEIIVAYVLLL